ncbi:MAG: glutamate--tRNA ligase [Pseudomonadota bacterium]
MTVRTRFAPSPTGFLHVGGARTALFCYLYARRHGGEFVLRIEDTDRERSTQESVDSILEGMAWLGLESDEAPIFQSSRNDRYREVIERLLTEGHAYRCYCSPEQLEAMRAAQEAAGLKPRYDGTYRDFTGTPPAGVKPVIRFRNPLTGSVSWDDAVKGRIEVSNEELDDLIIARSDGSPTYNLTVVVDDLDMQISHVVRGDDHVNNTPRQINMYRAMGAEPPVFAHLPMILGSDGSRLSKRHGAVSVLAYRDEGYLPEALLNYLVRLGWSHGDQELFSLEEMISLFDLKDVNRAPASFNTDKLRWLNQQYQTDSDIESLGTRLAPFLEAAGYDLASGPPPAAVAELLRERAATLQEMAQQADFLFVEPARYEEKAEAKQFKAAALEPLQRIRQQLAQHEDWTSEALQAQLQRVVDELGVGFGKVGQPLRLALTGRGAAPGNDQVLALLGQDRSLGRIDRALDLIQARAETG